MKKHINIKEIISKLEEIYEEEKEYSVSHEDYVWCKGFMYAIIKIKEMGKGEDSGQVD